jgi:hypothetical protein
MPIRCIFKWVIYAAGICPEFTIAERLWDISKILQGMARRIIFRQYVLIFSGPCVGIWRI